MAKVLSGKDVAAHNKRDDCWIIIHGACARASQVGTPD